MTDRAQAAAAVEATTDALGRLDVLVNNAGSTNVNSIEDFAEDDFRAEVETNPWGVTNLTRAAVPVLRERASGHILQISSVGGRDAIPGLGPYQTAKWAVDQRHVDPERSELLVEDLGEALAQLRIYPDAGHGSPNQCPQHRRLPHYATRSASSE